MQRNQARIYIYPPHQYHFPFICQAPLRPLSQLGPVRAWTHDLWADGWQILQVLWVVVWQGFSHIPLMLN